MSSRGFQPREPRYFLLGRMRAIERAAHRAMLEAIQEAGYPYMRTPHIALMAHMTPEGLRITEFADLMQVTKSAASQLVTWLERHGLVERVPDPADRRATLVRATGAADAGFRAARHRYAEIEDEWERAIGSEGLAKLAGMLSELDSLRPKKRRSPRVREG
jgi:DNA-binding MarR family transcriptional regulator